MTDDLSTRLAVLTEDRPEPVDPAASIRLRIDRRRRRRRGAAIVVTAAAVTAAALSVGPLLGSHRSTGTESEVAGFAPPVPSVTPTVTTTATTPRQTKTPMGDHTTVMPAPWSDEVFTKLPDANAYRPKAYYLAKGSIPTQQYGVLTYSRQGCVVTDEGPANSFGRVHVCFDDWAPGQRSAFHVAAAHTREKSGEVLPYTLVVGAVSADARKVHLKSAGTTYIADATATPATDQLRFFTVLIPKKNATVASVTPLDAAGKLTAPPANPPQRHGCGDQCTLATPR
ncbi:hypothetical protein [Kribbella sp. CA-247076]|uniref:hypothetical protein n=1 Tax=Kribbella sp. CA-247076 TaxID=3239941 RepID=UPI003D921845